MNMGIREIVYIDEEKCNGCGLCVPNCAEGAIQIIDGKAKLVSDSYCDGLGACLGHCPMDAISIIKRESEEFDENLVEEHLRGIKMENENMNHSAAVHPAGGCPGSRMMQFDKKEQRDEDVKIASKLRQWPVQLALVPPSAPYFKGADLLITADCVPFAYGNYHNDFLRNRAVVVGCPKLDDVNRYIEKLEELIKINDLESITVLKMEVPCCSGIASAAKLARNASEIEIPIKVVTISLEGEVLKKEYI